MNYKQILESSDDVLQKYRLNIANGSLSERESQQVPVIAVNGSNYVYGNLQDMSSFISKQKPVFPGGYVCTCCRFAAGMATACYNAPEHWQDLYNGYQPYPRFLVFGMLNDDLAKTELYHYIPVNCHTLAKRSAVTLQVASDSMNREQLEDYLQSIFQFRFITWQTIAGFYSSTNELNVIAPLEHCVTIDDYQLLLNNIASKISNAAVKITTAKQVPFAEAINQPLGRDFIKDNKLTDFIVRAFNDDVMSSQQQAALTTETDIITYHVITSEWENSTKWQLQNWLTSMLQPKKNRIVQLINDVANNNEISDEQVASIQDAMQQKAYRYLKPVNRLLKLSNHQAIADAAVFDATLQLLLKGLATKTVEAFIKAICNYVNFEANSDTIVKAEKQATLYVATLNNLINN